MAARAQVQGRKVMDSARADHPLADPVPAGRWLGLLSLADRRLTAHSPVRRPLRNPVVRMAPDPAAQPEKLVANPQ